MWRGDKLMQLIKKVIIKQVLTENSKSRMWNEWKQTQEQLERECEQLLFEQRKLQHKHGKSKQVIKDRFLHEIETRKEKIKQIDFKIEQLSLLELGSEIVEQEMDAMVEVTVGTKWSAIHEPSTIVIRDDIVVRMENN